jgi:glycosyltransferase involved in cell wall biosynthesis
MISVIIPSYNRYDLLLNAIESVRNQTFKDIEIIVIDDCSSDDRYVNLQSIPDIKYFKMIKRTGLPSKVRNHGILQSNGEWIAFLDDDDTWVETKLEEQYKMTNKYDFICTDSFYENVILRKVRELHIWENSNPTNTNELNLDIIKRHNLIINSSVLIKKTILEEIGYIPENKEYRAIEDHITWIKILEKGYVCFFVDLPLMNYNNSSYKHHSDSYLT